MTKLSRKTKVVMLAVGVSIGGVVLPTAAPVTGDVQEVLPMVITFVR